MGVYAGGSIHGSSVTYGVQTRNRGAAHSSLFHIPRAKWVCISKIPMQSSQVVSLSRFFVSFGLNTSRRELMGAFTDGRYKLDTLAKKARHSSWHHARKLACSHKWRRHTWCAHACLNAYMYILARMHKYIYIYIYICIYIYIYLAQLTRVFLTRRQVWRALWPLWRDLRVPLENFCKGQTCYDPENWWKDLGLVLYLMSCVLVYSCIRIFFGSYVHVFVFVYVCSS